MANIKYAGKIDGTSLPRIQKFFILGAKDIAEGTPIAIKDDNTPSTTFDANTTGMFGVTARDYKCTADEFNPENGTSYVSVNVSPDAVYELPLTKTVTAATSMNDGSITLTTTEFNNVAESLTGVALKLIKHGSNPAKNAIKIGEEHVISAYEVTTAGKLELYFNTAPAVTAGDEYLLVPHPSFDRLTIKNGDVSIATAAADKSYFTVVECDSKKDVAYIRPKNYLA